MPGIALPDQGTQSVDINTFRLQREREFFGGLRFFLSDVPNETTGMVGVHLDQTNSADSTPFGLSFDIAETPVFEMYVSGGTINVKASDPVAFTVGSLNVTGPSTLSALTVTGATSLAGATISGTSALTTLTVSGTSLLSGVLTAVNVDYSGNLSNTAGGLRLNTASVTPGADADYTLLAAEYKCGIVILNTGSWTAGHNVIFPLSASSVWHFVNTTAFIATLKGASGTGIAVAAGRAATVRHDGTNMRRVSPDLDFTV